MKKQKEIKHLYIELKKDIQQTIFKYCAEVGVHASDVGFAVGYLNRNLIRDIDKFQLTFLLQTYFFAGVYYAKTTKKFEFAYLTKEERSTKIEMLKKRLGMMNKEPAKPDYMG